MTHRLLSLQPRRRRHSRYTSGAGLPAATSFALTTNSGRNSGHSPAFLWVHNGSKQASEQTYKELHTTKHGAAACSKKQVEHSRPVVNTTRTAYELCCCKCVAISDAQALSVVAKCPAPELCRLCRIFSGAPEDATPTPMPAARANFTKFTMPGKALH